MGLAWESLKAWEKSCMDRAGLVRSWTGPGRRGRPQFTSPLSQDGKCESRWEGLWRKQRILQGMEKPGERKK